MKSIAPIVEAFNLRNKTAVFSGLISEDYVETFYHLF